MAGTTIACKNHGSEYLEDAKAVILIMRNPYDSFKVRVKLISSEFKKNSKSRNKSMIFYLRQNSTENRRRKMLMASKVEVMSVTQIQVVSLIYKMS